MATSTSSNKKQTSAKEILSNQIISLLQPVKETLKKDLGEKKLDKRIKKAARLLVHGIKPRAAVKKPAKKAPVKKAGKRKSIPVAVKKSPVVKPAKS
ncbi:MAG: hypothetical protein IPP72_16030 [Chitinophagaceae bacterium]|nr:hypothetical protein [Chitinophagaceae bacterium]